MRKPLLGFAILGASLLLTGIAYTQSTKQPLTIEKLLEIKHPSMPVWSSDGHHVAFLWDEGGVVNLYVSDTAASQSAPVALTTFKEGQLSGHFWSRNGRTLFFPHGGTLWQVSVTGGDAKPVWSDLKASNFALSPDGEQIAYVRQGSETGAELCVRALPDGNEKNVAHDTSIVAPVWSPDGKLLAYTAGGNTIIHNEAPAYSGAKIIYTITERTPGKLFVVSSAGGAPKEIDAPASSGAVRWLNPQQLVFDRQSDDFKKRTSYIADANSGTAHPVHEDVEEKFWSIPYDAGASSQPSPNGKWIAFLSDRDGWDHLYVMPASGGDPVQITKGHFEAWRPVWSHDSKRIAFDANSSSDPGDRHLFVADIGNDPAHASIQSLTSERGTDTSPAWSPDDTALLYQHTDPHNSADLFTLRLQAEAKPVRLSESMPKDIDRDALVEPEFVHYPGADGTPVPGWLFVPKGLDRTKQHPVVVWIHGDGINQNYDGWHVQRNYAVYYSFHQYLLQQGYIVFAPDYRGSIGYGRDWRDAVYHDIGGKDAEDAWRAANYLKTLPYVDPNRIGVWGLSYGGFFTLVAMTDQPTLFRAGIDVAGVVDFRMYYTDPYHSAWTASRIGTPEQNPQVYAKASPISHIDRLQHPLLVLHGTADVNVPYLESVRLIDEALKHQKGDLLQFMMYPGEFHYFDREHVLRDAWHRADEFFHKQLLTPSTVKP